jgi:hypothetical protein
MSYLNPGYLPVNSCSVFTVTPMIVKCNVTNVIGKDGSANGSITLGITGGTTPYTITWTYPNGITLQGSQTIDNLSVGTYTASVTDYYGDFMVTTSCTVSPPPTTTTTTSTTTAPPFELFNFCLTILYISTEQRVGSSKSIPLYFIPSVNINGFPSWISSPLGNEIVYYDPTIPTSGGWSLSGSPTSQITLNNFEVFNSNPSYPPIPGINLNFTSWTILNAFEGSVISNLGNCLT